jgi:hypothetical protein
MTDDWLKLLGLGAAHYAAIGVHDNITFVTRIIMIDVDD